MRSRTRVRGRISIVGTYKKPNLPVSLSNIVKSLLRRVFVRFDRSEYFGYFNRLVVIIRNSEKAFGR